jgi:hypothetical protein
VHQAIRLVNDLIMEPSSHSYLSLAGALTWDDKRRPRWPDSIDNLRDRKGQREERSEHDHGEDVELVYAWLCCLIPRRDLPVRSSRSSRSRMAPRGGWVSPYDNYVESPSVDWSGLGVEAQGRIVEKCFLGRATACAVSPYGPGR